MSGRTPVPGSAQTRHRAKPLTAQAPSVAKVGALLKNSQREMEKHRQRVPNQAAHHCVLGGPVEDGSESDSKTRTGVRRTGTLARSGLRQAAPPVSSYAAYRLETRIDKVIREQDDSEDRRRQYQSFNGKYDKHRGEVSRVTGEEILKHPYNAGPLSL